MNNLKKQVLEIIDGKTSYKEDSSYIDFEIKDEDRLNLTTERDLEADQMFFKEIFNETIEINLDDEETFTEGESDQAEFEVTKLNPETQAPMINDPDERVSPKSNVGAPL